MPIWSIIFNPYIFNGTSRATTVARTVAKRALLVLAAGQRGIAINEG